MKIILNLQVVKEVMQIQPLVRATCNTTMGNKMNDTISKKSDPAFIKYIFQSLTMKRLR